MAKGIPNGRRFGLWHLEESGDQEESVGYASKNVSGDSKESETEERPTSKAQPPLDRPMLYIGTQNPVGYIWNTADRRP